MSQAGIINVAGGGGGGAPVLTLTGDTGGPVSPTANNIFTIGGSSSENNINGITIAGNPGISTLVTTLTNRAFGTVTTVGLVSQNLITFTPPLIAGVYAFTIEICAWDNINLVASTYTMLGSVKANGLGALATIGTPIRSMRGENPPFDVTQADVIILGANIIVEVTGLVGQTISWTGLLTYVFGGV